MTNEKAIKTLRGAYNLLLQCRVRFEFMTDFKEALRIAIEVIEKQEPRHVMASKSRYGGRVHMIYICPRCEALNSKYSYYCTDCGQALEWGEL